MEGAGHGITKKEGYLAMLLTYHHVEVPFPLCDALALPSILLGT